MSSWLKRATNETEMVIAPKRGHTLKVDVSGRLFFPLCKGFINAQSVMPVKNYANMPKT